MQLYKDSNGNTYRFDSPEQAQERAPGCEPISEAEYAAICQSRAPSADALLRSKVRASRDMRLASSDWTQLPDSPLTAGQKTAWQAYRKLLRDVTAQTGFPATVDWPVAP